MTETGKIMQAVDAVEHDLKHCGYLRKEATEQYLPTLIRAAKAQFAEARGSAALAREQDEANELYQAACCLMRYKEADQWHNLENAAHRFNAARLSRINDEVMRQNAELSEPGTPDGSLATETRKPGSLK